MHFGSPGGGGSTFGHVRAALEVTFLNSAVDANGECLILLIAYTHIPVTSAMLSSCKSDLTGLFKQHVSLLPCTLALHLYFMLLMPCGAARIFRGPYDLRLAMTLCALPSAEPLLERWPFSIAYHHEGMQLRLMFSSDACLNLVATAAAFRSIGDARSSSKLCLRLSPQQLPMLVHLQL